MTTKTKLHDVLRVARYEDGCDEVWGVFEANATHAVIELRFWDEGDGAKRRRMEEKARLFGAAPQMLDALQVAEECLALHVARNFGRKGAQQAVRAAIETATRCESPLPRLESDGSKERLKIVTESIGNVLKHFYSDEARDFEAASEEGRATHILRDLNLLEKWRKDLLQAMGNTHFGGGDDA
jgi:hypothetical protein